MIPLLETVLATAKRGGPRHLVMPVSQTTSARSVPAVPSAAPMETAMILLLVTVSVCVTLDGRASFVMFVKLTFLALLVLLVLIVVQTANVLTPSLEMEAVRARLAGAVQAVMCARQITLARTAVHVRTAATMEPASMDY
mmetsp:Transcript_13949/g.35928  ORF Transcript_13949/g.35928 Transcript_13949/m.35928 type:complete len:140 (+) Transcript_13949:627-1046(+)